LVLGKSTFGGTGSDSGSVVERQGLSAKLTAPASILKATITVTDLKTDETCASNPAVGSAQARLAGAFFNIRPGGPLGGGNKEGDVIALFMVLRNTNSGYPVGVLPVQGVLVGCSNADCTTLSFVKSVGMGTTTVGTRVVGQLAWDKANKTFSFSRDNQAPVSISYTEDDSVDPSVPVNSVSVQNTVANCMSGPRVKGGMQAWFDNVSIVP
jgi:hypothetical protein